MSTTAEDPKQLIANFRKDFDDLQNEISSIILGQEEVVTATLIALVAGGHVLVEGVPGLGKTLLAKTLADALSLTREAMANHHYKALLTEVEKVVTQGGSISNVVGRSPLVSPAFAEAVRSGEESGQVGKVLLSLAEYLEEDNAVLVKSVTQLLEPVVLILLGLVVGVVAISMFLPLFDATAATGVGGGA